MELCNTMQTLLSKLSQTKGVELRIEESTWFNGHGYFPMYSYQLNYPHSNWEVTVAGEFRSSEQSKPTGLNQGVFTDACLWSFIFQKAPAENDCNFEICRSSWIQRNLLQKPALRCNVSDQALQHKLISDPNIQAFFTQQHAPTTAVITGKINQQKFQVQLNFNTNFRHEQILNSAIEMLESLSLLVTTSKASIPTTLPQQ